MARGVFGSKTQVTLIISLKMPVIRSIRAHAAAALLLLLTVAASAQPTTRPAAVDWTPATPIVAGGTYRLPAGAGVHIEVTVADVTFRGGPVYGRGGTAIYFKAGGDRGRVVGVQFDAPDPPAARVKIPNVGTCVVTEAAGTEVVGCDFGAVNECVRAMPGSSALKVSGCRDTKGDIRGAWCYMAGVRGALLTGNVFLDSATENGIRTSPQGDAISSDVVVRDNVLKNPGNKMAIDARHVRGIKIEHNAIYQVRDANGGLVPAVRLGDSSLPGCSGLVFHDNDVFDGSVHAKGQSAGVFEVTRFHGVNPATDVPCNLDLRSGLVPNFTTAFYVGPLPARVKPVSTIPGQSNAWVNAATTQPVQ